MEFNIEYFCWDEGYEETMKYTPSEGNKIIYKFSNRYGDYIGQTKFSVRKRAGINGKWYLENPDTKWAYGIKTFGFDGFGITILEECPEDQADEREKFYIAKYNSWQEGFNSTPGGAIWQCPSGGLRKFKVEVKDLFDELDTNALEAWVGIYDLLLCDKVEVPLVKGREDLLNALTELSEKSHRWWTNYSYYAYEGEYANYRLTVWELIYNFELLDLNAVEIYTQINTQYASRRERIDALWSLLSDECMRREILGGDYITSGDREWTEFIFDYPKNEV